MASEKKMQVYGSWPYRTLRVIWLIKELGVESEAEFIPFDIAKASKDDLEKLGKVHPHRTLPGFVADGECIVDSAAACLYLADKYGKMQPAPGERIHYYNWTIYCSSTVDFILQPVYWHCKATPEEQWDQELIEKQSKKFMDFGNYFTKHFKKRQFVCGDQFTAADCVLGYTVWWSSFILHGTLTNKFPVMLEYLERIKGRSAFQDTFKFPDGVQ